MTLLFVAITGTAWFFYDCSVFYYRLNGLSGTTTVADALSEWLYPVGEKLRRGSACVYYNV